MGKSSPSVPNVPSAADTAAAQGQSNTSTAAAQAALNLINQKTPYGSTTYTQSGNYTTPQGDTVPRYTQDVQLSPLGQQLLTGQQGVASTLIPTSQKLADQAAQSTATPLNFNTPFSDTLNKSPQLLNQDVTNQIYNQEKSFLDPQWEQQGQQLQDQMSRQGIPVGSEAYNNAMKQLANSRTQAYQSAQSTAIGQGTSAASGMFGLAQAGQNQNLQQQQMAQQQPLSLLSQLYGATPATPVQPISAPAQATVSPTDLVGATASQNNAAMQAYQTQIAQNNATTGAVGGGAAAIAAAVAAAYI